MNQTNYHSHCDFCDGKAPMEAFVKEAVAEGFSAYGVSSHAPLPFPSHYTMVKERVPEYLQEIARLRALYGDRIELYAGMEIDYLDKDSHPANAYFQSLPLDYRIGSVHLIYTDEGRLIDTDTGSEHFHALLAQYFKGDLRRMVGAYFQASMEMVELGGFDFVGHADKIAYNAECCVPGVTGEAWYAQLRNDFFDLVAEKGLMLEINTKAWLKRQRFFPDKSCWKGIAERGIPVVVNSDSHLPSLINAGRREALEGLKAMGFRTVRELHGGKWQDVPIGA